MVMGVPARILENIDFAIEKGQLDVADLKLIVDNIESFIDDLENEDNEEWKKKLLIKNFFLILQKV